MGAPARKLEELPVPTSETASQAGVAATLDRPAAGNQASLTAGQSASAMPFARPEHAIDPASNYYWERFGESEYLRAEYFDITLAAAPGDYLNSKAELEANGPPSREPEMARFASRLKVLVRLMALSLMATHRATMEGRQTEVLKALDDKGTGKGTGAVNARSETVAMVLQAADHIRELDEIKLALIDSRVALSGMASRALHESRMSADDVEGYLVDIRESITPFLDDEGRERFNYTIERFGSPGSARDPNARRMTPAALWGLTRDLAAWRQRQINVVAGQLYQLHETFPFFAKVGAKDVLQSNSEAQVAAQARAGYAELLAAIDTAIVEVGSGDIDAFDLPEAVKLTIQDLPPALQSAARRVIAHHRTVQFWKSMGLAGVQLAIAFIPVVGPFIAAGIGAVQFGADLESMLDKSALAAASNQPGRGVLGVEGPNTGDWAMMIAAAALTIADLRAGVKVAREYSAPRPMHELDYERLPVAEQGTAEPRVEPPKGARTRTESPVRADMRARTRETAAGERRAPKWDTGRRGPPGAEEQRLRATGTNESAADVRQQPAAMVSNPPSELTTQASAGTRSGATKQGTVASRPPAASTAKPAAGASARPTKLSTNTPKAPKAKAVETPRAPAEEYAEFEKMLADEFGATGPISSDKLLQFYRHGSRPTVVKYLKQYLRKQAAAEGVMTVGDMSKKVNPRLSLDKQVDAFVESLEGAHSTPQAFGKKLPKPVQKSPPGGKYNPDDALVAFTDKPTHTAMDQPWKDAFNNIRKGGAKTATAHTVYDEVADGIRKTPGMGDGEKASRVARLHDEMFTELRLVPDREYPIPRIYTWWEILALKAKGK